jgi:uncharacterized protein YukE
MNHKVNNVQGLYASSQDLYNIIVVGGDASADSIIHNLRDGIENLKHNWKGMDAGKKIQETITVHNEMVKVRNALAQLAYDSSVIASQYREIQVANGATLEYLSPLKTEPAQPLADHTDNADTVDIVPEAEQGRVCIDTANTDLDTFIQNVTQKYTELMDNWTAGTGRDGAQTAFDEFVANVKNYKNILTDTSDHVAAALKNYSF